jgi:hypothetical protein
VSPFAPNVFPSLASHYQLSSELLLAEAMSVQQAEQPWHLRRGLPQREASACRSQAEATPLLLLLPLPLLHCSADPGADAADSQPAKGREKNCEGCSQCVQRLEQ